MKKINEINKKMKLYDMLYKQADQLHKKYNPCNIKFNQGNSGELVTCYGCPYFCCEGCRHNGPKGCRVKSLSCKLWLCDKSLSKINHELYILLCDMIYKAKNENLLYTRASRTETKRILEGKERRVKLPKHLRNVDMFENIG